MKITFYQLLLGLVLSGLAYASPINAQGVLNKSVNIAIEQRSLEKVLDYLEASYAVKFIYSRTVIDVNQTVSIHIENEKLKALLDELLRPNGIDYEVVKDQILLSKALPMQPSQPQPLHLSGTVKNKDGEPIAGVTVLEKGTKNGTTTDSNGNFSISVKDNLSVISIQSIGYISQEIAVGDQRRFQITLKADLNELDEIVVVGYGTQARKDITGSVVSINEKTLREVPATNAQQLLQGRAPGVYVTQSANKPGSVPRVIIRGNRSFQGGNDPLYVVDGIPISGGFNDINPSDITSMEVLKDASATAIYGSRGSNGVIIISTRRGSEGKPVVSLNSSLGTTHVVRYADVFSGEEFVAYKREANRAVNNYDDANPEASDAKIFEAGELENIKAGRYTSWRDLITGEGFSQQHELAVNGGSPHTRYNLSLGYFDDQGYFSNQDYTRYTTRVNLDQDIGSRVKAGISMLGTYSEQNGANVNPYMASLVQTPLGYPYDETGKLVPFPTGDALMYNLLADFVPGAVIDVEKRFRLLTSLYAEAELADGLKFRMNFGPDLANSRTGKFWASNTTARQGGLPAAGSGESLLFSYTWENMLTYDKVFAEKHKVNFTGLYSIQERKLESSNINVQNLPAESMEYFNLGAADIISGVGSGFEKWTILSYMGRLNYSYDDRFLFTLTGRADGSSRFAPGHKWGFFPSAAFAYNLSEEKFIKNIPQINNMKLRLSYGKVGNTGIDPYQTQSLLTPTAYDFNGTNGYGARPSQISNPNLRWESTASLNAGLDFGLFNSRLSGSIDVYRSKTTDLLLPWLLPITTGYSSVLTNIGSTRNKGIEVNLSSINVSSPDQGFGWSTELNVAYNQEKIVELSQGKADDVGSLFFIGQPIKVYYDYQKLGIWQLGEDAEAKQYSSSVGQIKVADRNGNGVIDPNDRMLLGKVDPPWTFGFNNRFSYKNFDLAVFAVARSGNMIASTYHSVPNNSIALGGRYNMLDVDYWTPNNPTNAYPRPINGQSGNPGPVFGSTLKYFNGSFIRIRNINLGYTFAESIAHKIKAQSLRLSFDITNPFIISPYVHNDKGIDPEILDNPAVVNYLFGLQVKF